MKTNLKKSVLSAFAFFGTLVILSVVYAAYQTINSTEYAPGAPMTSSLMGKIVGNIDALNTRLSSAETTIASQATTISTMNTTISTLSSTGAIMAFNLATCPNGWSEYTPAYGRFIRGIDKSGTAIDPDGQRALGNIQTDAFQGHWHQTEIASNGNLLGAATANYKLSANASAFSWNYTTSMLLSNGNTSSRTAITDSINGTPRIASETRPTNVALLYCIKN